MIHRQIKQYAFIASLTLHVLMVPIVFISLSTYPKVIIVENKGDALTTYLYKENKPFSIPRILSKNEPIQRFHERIFAHPHLNRPHAMVTLPVPNLKQTLSQQLATVSSSNQQTLSAPMEESSKQGKQKNELLALLHAAIQKEQHYPNSALQMEREGRVKVEFMLDVDGSMSGLRIIRSSGTASLDEAALAAIHRASPFQRIRPYLHVSQMFRIDVVFELA